RRLTGEAKNEPLFEAVLGLMNFLKIDEAKVDKVDSALFSADELRSIETISVMRILYFLGYFSQSDVLAPFFEGFEWSQKALADFLPLRTQATAAINNALKESQL
ncbi:MAG: hypothetical protein PHF79_00995, partial [Candidatus Pacebacteria bacterium]|nr:hypothetical protein [Candidatus Paceibacterota bacterium]